MFTRKLLKKAGEKLSYSKWLAYFNVKQKTRLQTDASHLFGLGVMLKQEVEPGEWSVVQARGKFQYELKHVTPEWNWNPISDCHRCQSTVQVKGV
jgi:hypothetical protein